MASASCFDTEGQFLCSICLDVYTQPVSTPCGHNYCKACITGYWDSSERTECPLCKERFSSRPTLQVNTSFRDMVEHFNSMRVEGRDKLLARPGEVPCDVCLEPKLKANKTCLVCLASYCQSHLEPHQRAVRLKKHQLIEPLLSLEDRICRKHDKMLELFCRKDKSCICLTCLKDNHVGHVAVPLELASRERKAWLENVMTEVKSMEEERSMCIKEIKFSVQQNKMESESHVADIVEVFDALLASLKRSQGDLIQLIKERQRAAEKVAEHRITQLEQEVAKWRRTRSELDQLLQAEDHVQLLQGWSFRLVPDFQDPPDFVDCTQQIYVGMVKKSVARMEETLTNEMEMLIHEVRLSDGCEVPVKTEQLKADDFIEEVWPCCEGYNGILKRQPWTWEKWMGMD